MATELTQNKIMQVLDWAYEKSINGIPGVDSAIDLANDYMKVEGSRRDQVDSLIRWQNAKAGTSGFLTGLGGLITMPVAIPLNISSVLYVQIRMIAAIAYMGGHDLKDDRVKAMVYSCLTGNAIKELLKDVGVVIGKKFTEQAIKNISGKSIIAINKAVGFRLLTKFGARGVINLGKAVPIVGGVVGATFDSVSTNALGNIARDVFIDELQSELCGEERFQEGVDK